MYILGENIHIISDKVKEALKLRDAGFFQDLAVKQVEAGAQALDLNLGPRKADWAEDCDGLWKPSGYGLSDQILA